MNYIKKVEKIFWSNMKEEELQVNDENCEFLEQAIRLMELDDESKANQEIEDSNELKSLFGFNSYNILNKIESFSSEEQEDFQETEADSSEDEETENLRTNNQQTTPPTTPKKETGETSGIKKPEENRKRKGNFYPSNPEFKGTTTNIFGSNVLNIDGKPNRKELIDAWAKEISLVIQTNKEAYDDQSTVLLLVEHKTLGVVNSFIKNTTWDPVMSPITAFENILDAIYTMFLGINQSSDKLQELLKIKTKAKTMLTNMQLCDICFLDQFFCDYEKYLYQLDDQAEYVKYVKDYLLKIPLVGLKALERFNLEAIGPSEYSLAYAQRIVKEEITKVCDLTKKQKQLKSFSKQCCEKIIEKPFEYGCRKSSYKKPYKKKSYNKHTTRYRFNRKKKSFKPGKYVKKKSFKKFSNEKQKFCPKGKKNCRCWICNEEGHYANECPNRKKHDGKVQMLDQVYSLGYVPIEDPYEDTQEVYSIEEIDPGPEESDSNDSSFSESD